MVFLGQNILNFQKSVLTKINYSMKNGSNEYALD